MWLRRLNIDFFRMEAPKMVIRSDFIVQQLHGDYISVIYFVLLTLFSTGY